MSIKIESGRLFKVFFGEDKRLSVSRLETKNANQAIAVATHETNTDLICTAVESNAIYSGTVGIEHGAKEGGDESAVFEIVVRGTSAEMVKKLRNAIALAIGGRGLQAIGVPNGKSDNGCSLKKTVAENSLLVDGL